MEKKYRRRIQLTDKTIFVVDCPVCGNKGKVNDKKTHKERDCVVCNGQGWIKD